MVFPWTRFAAVVTLVAMIAWIEVEGRRRMMGDRMKPKSPLYLRIPARATQMLLVSLAWVLCPFIGDELRERD